MKNKNYFKKYLILVLPLLFINLNAQEQVDPLEAARLANSAAEKAQAEADAATEAAIQSAATKAASQARENAVQAKKDAEAKKIADAKAAEDAELDALAKAAGDEAKRKIALELGLDDDFSDFDDAETEDTDSSGGGFTVLGFTLNGGLPIYSATFLKNYSAGVTGGLTIHTSYGFNVGSLAFLTDLNVLYVDYGVDDDSGRDEFGNLGVFAQFRTNTSEILSFIPAETTLHLGVGFLPGNGAGFNAGGGLALPLNLPVGIGIVGNGFVGSAVQFGFSPTTAGLHDYEIKVYDKDPSKSVDSIEETVNKSDFIFLSVPTPSNTDGSMNLDIVEQALQDISDINENQDNIVLLRSTVTPGTTRKLQEKYPNLRIVFNPEFLTERSANFDFINQTRFILGGSSDDVIEVSELFRERFGHSISIVETNYETAELIKYMTNTFFATKISFLNDMKLLSDECGAIWEQAVEGFVRDGRIGHSHLNVPGPDGKLGFGGSCFPKDINALIKVAEKMDIPPNILSAAWDTNTLVRPEEDWRELKGRAVVEEKA